MEEVKDKGGRPGLGRCDRNCFCVFPCLSEIMSPSSAVLIELAVFVIAGGLELVAEIQKHLGTGRSQGGPALRASMFINTKVLKFLGRLDCAVN